MGTLRTLYVDMNSFFASVEQHLDSGLQGRPVAITAVDANSGSCVAASYEAKAFGVKTGTPVWKARRLCPGIAFLPSRHRLYVRFNLRVAAILDRLAELEKIRSVDEFQLRLSGDATDPDGAEALVQTMKRAVAEEIGPCLRFSAGCGPNHLLAKIAGKLQKPDGFRWLDVSNMPDAISHLNLSDLPGISKGIEHRLRAAGVHDVETLCRLDPRHARAIWHSVEGERFVRSLQCADVQLTATKRGGYGNSKVLSPDFREVRSAYGVGRWLTEKSAARLRRDKRVAARFTLSVRSIEGAGISRSIKCEATNDTAYFLRLHRALWIEVYRATRIRAVASLGVHLGDVSLFADRCGDLFRPLQPGMPSRGEVAADAVDKINRRYGAGAVTWGTNIPHPGFFERG